jgi:hypothetical protein
VCLGTWPTLIASINLEKPENLGILKALQVSRALSNGTRRERAAVLVALIAGLLVWLWPIGLGGRMPVGGDVTRFFVGLMGVYSRSLAQGRLTSWNDLWGYGFPGVGESQMGVYYPPHLMLYGTLPIERAYLASLLLHTIWAGLGAWWAARRFGVSLVGSGLAGFAFSASGFFVIHMPHPWGYTTGSWMAWAWGLSWSMLTSDGSSRVGKAFLLSLVLVLQILAGHFQLAFLTQFGIALLALSFLLDPGVARESSTDPPRVPSWAGRLRRLAPLAGCLAAAFPLAALQLWPTARLTRLASTERGFEYLSGFAVTPFHLVSFIAPGLFHRSPLWRKLVWDPFHTSPEELLAYVGLAPLFLAILEVRSGFRRDAVVRMLTILAAVSLVFSLGPYLPGFGRLIELPGFSFFRAPARWTLATSLALAILAGKGLDRCRQRPEQGRSLLGLAVLSAAWIVVVLGVIELALLSGSRSAHPWLAGLFQRAFQALPWPAERDFPAVMAQARLIDRSVDTRSFMDSRGAIYTRELAATAGLLAAIAALGAISSLRRIRRRPAILPAGLLVLSVVDLLLLGRYRLVLDAPLRSLAEQSPVLARLAQEPRGTRIVDGFGNLSMLVGLEPISAYRTLDMTALEPLTRLAQGPLGAESLASSVRKAMRACGVGVRVIDPASSAMERTAGRSVPNSGGEELIDDPALSGWLLDPAWVAKRGAWASRFRIIHPEPAPSRAWFLPLTELDRPAMLDSWPGDLEPLLDLFDRARPLPSDRPSAERLDVSLNADGPGWVIVSQLADPQWKARWSSESRPEVEAEIFPTFRLKPTDGGWQRVKVPGAGRWTLHLEYEARDVNLGRAISGLTCAVWCLVLAAAAVRTRKRSNL